MKRALVSIFWAFFMCLALTACSQSTGAVPREPAAIGSGASASTASPERPEAAAAASPETSAGKSASQAIWDAYAASYGKMYNNEFLLPESPPEEPDLLPLYLEGLKHENAYVRWACASRLFEFKYREKRPEILDALEPLLEDESETVRKAAAFSTEVLDGSYDGPEFIKASDGKFVVFHAFHETRYNDGRIWLDNGDAGGFYRIDTDGSLGAISISPDNSKLCYSDYGRIWSGVSVYDISSGKSNYCNLYGYIVNNKSRYGYKTGANQRPDPYVSFIEWSPDSKKLLLFCSFTDDEYKTHKVSAVYDTTGGGFERVEPLPDGPAEEYNPGPEKPEGFKW
jgi:hypothetical protein